MKNKSSLILLVLTLFSLKVHCDLENIKFFLMNYEITNSTNVDLRRIKYFFWEEAEKSIQFQAFGKTFTLDLRVYFHREDSEVAYISKLRNLTDGFLNSKLLLYYGYVRDVKDSYAVGYFSNQLFRGYVLTDEVYCVEPDEEERTLIVYRFKDVIVPGCSKMSDNGTLDCAETMYFMPWKPNKPPTLKMSSHRYSLFYDTYFEIFNRRQKEEAEKKAKDSSKGQNDAVKGKKEDHKKKDGKEEGKNNEKSKQNGTESDKGNKKDGSRSKSNISVEVKAGNKTGTRDKIPDEVIDAKKHSKKGENKEEKHKGGKHKSKSEDDEEDEDGKHENEDDKKRFRRFDVSEENQENLLHQTPSADPRNVTPLHHNSKHTRPNVPKNISSPLESPGMLKESLQVEENENVNIDKTDETDVHSPVMEKLEEGNVRELQCNVEIVVDPSLRKKFGYKDDSILQYIYTQFTLLNKIFRKVTLSKKNAPFRLTLNLQKIGIYADELYNPLKKNADLEFFTKSHPPQSQLCLIIGIVNKFLRSGQFFDGYIPEGDGGACATSGNTLIVSHGNENTPAPMALFFASLMRGITRALGANDRDAQCTYGTQPNPMQVLKDYLLEPKEIIPAKEFSIFSTCNILDIDKAIRFRECFMIIKDPLCGNAIIDKGEECDCGPAFECGRIDDCCNVPHVELTAKKEGDSYDKGCTLIEGAKCSTHQECCTVCQIEKEKRVCYNGNGACDMALCDGQSGDCPKDPKASEGMICSAGNGTSGKASEEPLICRNSTCKIGLCAFFNLNPCTCAIGSGRECVYCCIRKVDGKCLAAGPDLNLVEGKGFYKPDGTSCMGGRCQDGKCSLPPGMKQVLNYTVKKSGEDGGCSYSSPELKIVVGVILSSLLTLFLQ